MTIIPADQFKSSLKPGTKLLCLDISKSMIGVAFADISTNIVTPVNNIARKRLKDDAERLLQLTQQYGTKSFVVGWPLNMDGTEGKRCQAVKDTVLELQKTLQSAKFVFADERQSTQEAYRLVEEIGGNSGKNKGKPVDNHAAMVILRAFLDELQRRSA